MYWSGKSMELKDRVAIVTGGAKGIGFASAECLMRLGAAVLLVDVSAEALDTAKRSLSVKSGQVDGATADISKMADAERAVQTAVERFGGVDILVNNAG